MSDKEITQGLDLAGEPNEEREEDGDGGDPEEDLALSEEERLVRQRASHEARRKRAKTAVKKGLVIVNTGKGKGKTTAAMGLLLRADRDCACACCSSSKRGRPTGGKRKRLAKWAWR